MSKMLVTKRERKLLLSSEALRDFPKAFDFIRDYPNEKDGNLDNLPIEIQEFFLKLYDRVQKNATEEWSASSKDAIYVLDENKKIKCELCGQEIKNVCEISNKLNNKILRVGTECVKHFGMAADIPLEKIIEKKRQMKKYEYIVKYFPDIEKDVEFWDDELGKYSIMIIDELEIPYDALGKEFKELYDKYLKDKNSKKNKYYIRKIMSIYNRRLKLIQDINTYVNESENKEFVATKQIEKWLIRNYKTGILNYVKQSGVIDWRAAIQIEEPEFVNMAIRKFNIHFKKQHIYLKIIRFIPQKGLEVEIFYKYRIHILLNYKDFMMFHGGILFDQESIEKINLLDIIRKNDILGEDSEYLTISLINDKSKKQGIYIQVLERDIDFFHGDMFVYLKEEKCFVMPKIKDITTRYKELAFDPEAKSVSGYIKFLKNHKRIHEDDAREIRENRKRMVN